MEALERVALDARLEAIARMVGRADCVADVGCDHGRLCASLLLRGWIRRAVMSDISKPSLDKARALIRSLGLGDRVAFCVCDGIPAAAEDADAVVIAGMGGRTIADILARAGGLKASARLVLSANVRVSQLRDSLEALGWKIDAEDVAEDGQRCYVIMKAVRGRMALTDEERVVGPCLLEDRPDALGRLRAFHIRVAERALAGAEKSARPEEADPIRKELEIWRRLRL